MKKKLILSSIIYKAMERFCVKFIGLAIGIVLARLLTAEIFGQVAIISVFINLSNVFIQTGFCTSLVQRNDVTDDDYSTALFICLSLSFCFVGILWLIAPVLANFYSNEFIAQPLRTYAFVLPFGAFNSVQLAKAQKEMKFKKMVLVNLITSLISGAIGIATAYYVPGVWALIVYYSSNTLLSSVGMLFVTRWFPKLVFSSARAKLLFDYGWKILVSGLLCSIYGDIRTLIIGKRFSDADLGYYNKGKQYPDVISNALDVSVQSVMLPALSSVQDDIPAVTRMLRRSMTAGTFVVTPIMMFLSAVSGTFVMLLLGEKWSETIPYMRVLCMADAFIPVLTSNLIAIKALGRSDIYVRLEFIRRIIMLVILVATILIFNSAYAIAVSCVISAIIDILIVMIAIYKLIGHGIMKQVKDLWKTTLASVVMAVAVYFVGVFLTSSMILCLLVQAVAGCVIYFGVCYILNNETLNYFIEMAKHYLLQRRNKNT